MSRFILFFMVLLLSCASSQIPPSGLVSSSEKEILIKNVNVIPMDSERVIEKQDVLIRDNKVVNYGLSGSIKHSSDAFVVDGGGKYLIPGLAEMHAHVPPSDDTVGIRETGWLFALKGITTIRGMLGHPKHLDYRKKLQSGEIIGPRFITSGPSFSGNSIKTPADAEKLVRDQKAAGYDFLKLHPGLTPETFGAMAKTAKEVGIPFAGHVSYKVGVWRAIESGYATIDHMDGFIEALVPGIENIPEADAGLFGLYLANKVDESRMPKLINGLKEKGIWVVPTDCLPRRWFAPDDPELLNKSPEMKYMKQETRDNWVNAKKNMQQNPKYTADGAKQLIEVRKKLLVECQKNGVGILLGSDAPQVFDVPGFSAHQELEYYVDAGLTPYEALQTGTVNVGRYLGRDDVGIIKTGAAADMILLNGNPLQNISATQQIEGVMLNGKWLPKEFIEGELKKLEKSR